MTGEVEESQKKVPQPQIESTSDEDESQKKPEKISQENNTVQPVVENNVDDSAKGQDSNDDERKMKELADRALNAILPEKKIEIMEKLARYGIPAVPYLTEIGYKSRWPRVKKRVLDLINEIYEQNEASA